MTRFIGQSHVQYAKKMQMVPLRCSDATLNATHTKKRCRPTSTGLACIHGLLFSLLIEPVLHSVPVLSLLAGAFQYSLHFPPFTGGSPRYKLHLL